MKNLLIIISVLLISISCKNSESSNKQLTRNVVFNEKDKAIFAEIIERYGAEKHAEVGNLLIEIGNYFKETPYVAHTLESDKEQLVVNLREFDCTTFAENCLAITQTIKNGNPDFDNFTIELQNIRYYNGKINDYTSRIHYFSDWIYENHKNGTINDVSGKVTSVPYNLNTGFMSSHPTSYDALKKDNALVPIIAKKEKEINARKMFFIPESKLPSVENLLENGDIVGITTAIKGLDISHVGILIRKNGRIHLMHASSLYKKVIISEETLEEYLLKSKNATGIMVARPL